MCVWEGGKVISPARADRWRKERERNYLVWGCTVPGSSLVHSLLHSIYQNIYVSDKKHKMQPIKLKNKSELKLGQTMLNLIIP